MHTLLRYVLLICLSVAAVNAAAANKIGFVDVERLLKESPQTAESNKRLEKEFSSRTEELERIQKQLSDAENSVNSKEADLTTQRLELERKQRELGEDINIRKNEEITLLQEHINKAIVKVAEAGDFDLVFYSGLAYTNKRIDLTDEVLKQLGKSSP